MVGQTAVLSEVKVYLEGKGIAEAGKLGSKQIGKLSSRMRMLGRDVLRLGGMITRYGMWFNTAFKGMTESSMDLGGAVEDISWAFEDIAAVLGDVLAPTFETIADIMDQVADLFESMPEWMKGMIAGFLIFGFVGMKVARVVMDMAGLFWLLKGSFLGTGSEVSSLWAKIGKLLPMFKGASEQTNILQGLTSKLQTKTMDLDNAMKDFRSSLFTGGKESGKYRAKITTLRDEIKDLEKQQAGLTKTEKKQAKGQKKAGRGLRGWVGAIGKVAGWMAVLATVMLIIAPLIEMLTPVFEAITDALMELFEPLEPIIEAIADWIEENPKLAASIIIGIVGAILALLLLKSPIMGFFGGMIDKGTSMMGVAKQGGNEILKLAFAVAIVALALTPLILAFTHFLVQMKEHNITIPEVIGYLFSLGGAILFIVGVLMALAIILSPTLPLMAGLALVLVAAGVAAYLFGHGIMLAGQGMEFAAKGLISLVRYLPQVITLVPALFGLAAAMMMLGVSLLVAIPGLFLGAVGLAALAGGITLVAGAVYMLASALSAIPDWARGFLGPVVGIMSKAIGGIPVLQKGGIVQQAGIAYLEPAEVITPAGGRAPGGGPIYNTFYITATIREEADLDKLAKKVSEKQAEEYGGRVYS